MKNFRPFVNWRDGSSTRGRFSRRLRHRIAGAGLDVTAERPLAASSPLWGMAVCSSPHTAGETSHYEDNVIDILRDNLGRLWRGEEQLRNQIV